MKKNEVIITIILVVLIFCSNRIFAASCGDVDSNGSVNIVDALLIAQYYVDLDPENFDPGVADVNGDSAINIVDALLVAQLYVGLISELTCLDDTPTPTPEPQTDPLWSGGPYTLNGTTDYVNLPGGITDNLNDFSITCWVYLNSVSNWVRVFDFGSDTNSFMMFTPASGNTGNPYFCITISGNDGEQGIDGNSTFPTGSWQHLAVTKNGTTGILYVNGREAGRNTGITLHPADLGNTLNNYIGRSQWSHDPYLNGLVDDFNIYDRALSSAEVASFSQNPPPIPTAGPTIAPGTDIWNLPTLPIANGPYGANYDSLKNYYTPGWFRDAKLGMWQHWDPQSVPEQGDWYARGMYQQGSGQYNYHVSTYGHPSVFGYKDICNLFKAPYWDPDELMDIFINAGAKYAVCLANHHDNYDMWDSAYQPWNVMNVGPKKDIMGLFAEAAKRRGLRFGMTFHATPPRTWGQFMPVKYGGDSGGQYDGLMTAADGIGTWWEGLNPGDLYGPNHASSDPSLTSPFANQFMWRVDDAITKYQPDLIYFDEHAGHTQVDLGVNMGLDFLSPQICANLYNKSYTWNGGIKDDVVCAMKGIGGIYNSFQGEEDVLEKAYHSMVPDTEKYVETNIQDYAFQIDESLGEWHYRQGMGFTDSPSVIRNLIDIVSKNGNLLLCLPQHGDGRIEPVSITICNEIGSWLNRNGEAIYGSRPFEVSQESAVRTWFTRRAGYVYALAATWPSSNQLVLSSLKLGGRTIGNVQKVEFLGSSLSFSQNNSALTIQCPGSHTNSQAYVFKITHDKPWVNDDDPGVHYTGYWRHQANRGLGDYNNDLYFTHIAGATCEYTFTGTGIDYISEKSQDMGNVDVYIDDVFMENVNLYNGSRLTQQVVYRSTGLVSGSHTIKIVNKSTQMGSVDAFRIY